MKVTWRKGSLLDSNLLFYHHCLMMIVTSIRLQKKESIHLFRILFKYNKNVGVAKYFIGGGDCLFSSGQSIAFIHIS